MGEQLSDSLPIQFRQCLCAVKCLLSQWRCSGIAAEPVAAAFAGCALRSAPACALPVSPACRAPLQVTCKAAEVHAGFKIAL